MSQNLCDELHLPAKRLSSAYRIQYLAYKQCYRYDADQLSLALNLGTSPIGILP